MIIIKPGVSITGIKPEINLAITIAHSIYQTFNYDLIITAGTEGKHSTGSLHYVGLAIDIRIRHIISQKELNKILDNLKSSLSPSYDVILHATHIHIEFQPKEPINA